jgi:hypothetical protein
MPEKEYSLVDLAKQIDRIEKMITLRFKDHVDVGANILLGVAESDGNLKQPLYDEAEDRSFTSTPVFGVTDRGIHPTVHSGPGAANLEATFTDFEQVVGILATFQADATVVDRVINVIIQKRYEAAAGAVKTIWKSQDLTCSAGQFGAIWLPQGGHGYYFVDDNATLADSTVLNNPVPFYVEYGDKITVTDTNAAAGDLRCLKLYRRYLIEGTTV